MEKKNKKLPIVIGVIALVVIIAVIIIVVILNKGHRVIKIESFSGDVELERGSDEEDIFVFFCCLCGWGCVCFIFVLLICGFF